MPIIPSKNGNAKKSPVPGNSLGDRLKSGLKLDVVKIGAKDYEFSEEYETASWADVRKLVAGIKWLVKGYVPYGMLTGIIAEPKVGKSAFALGALVRPIITGCNWFNTVIAPEKGYAVWCDTEGSAAINIQRAADWGLPDDRVKVPFPDDALRAINLEDAEHMTRIQNVISYYSAKLLVVDSFRGAHGGDENNSKIARVLQNLATVAEQTRAAVCIIHHTKKLSIDEEMTANSGRGSNAFLAMVRCQIAIDRPDPKGEWRRVQVLGENLGMAPKPIGFRFVPGGLEFGAAPEKQRIETQRDKAEDWLRDYMKPGNWYLAGELLADANSFGFSANAIQRAREAVGIVKPNNIRKTGKGWEWKYPAPNS